MKNLILVVTIILGIRSIHAQTPLIVEGVGEIMRFQTDLSKLQGGTITFRSSPSDYNGYMGIHRLRPGDVEFGTTLGSTGNVHITIKDDPKLTIDQDGNVIIKNLQGLPNSLSRPVTVGPAGDFSAVVTHYTTIPCNSFIANDQDGEYTEIVNPAGTVQFIQHTASSGELSAPISLPVGVRLWNVKIYYVNESTATTGANVRILRAPFIQLSDEGVLNVSGFKALPQAGSFTSSNGNNQTMDMGSVEYDLAHLNEYIDDFSLYSVNINCSDCSKLFIRSVELSYIYP